MVSRDRRHIGGRDIGERHGRDRGFGRHIISGIVTSGGNAPGCLDNSQFAGASADTPSSAGSAGCGLFRFGSDQDSALQSAGQNRSVRLGAHARPTRRGRDQSGAPGANRDADPAPSLSGPIVDLASLTHGRNNGVAVTSLIWYANP
jgi:hypothetical protein